MQVSVVSLPCSKTLNEDGPLKTSIVALAALACLAGCSTYSLPKYSASADTVAQLRKHAPAKVSVGAFTGQSAAVKSITCRGVGPVLPPDGESFGDYVRGALRAELMLADLYDEASPVRLEGALNGLDFSSGMTDAAWQMSMTLQSTTGGSVSATTDYKFKGSFVGETACNQTAQAGMGAVQALLRATVQDQRFSDLVKAKSKNPSIAAAAAQ